MRCKREGDGGGDAAMMNRHHAALSSCGYTTRTYIDIIHG